MSMLHARGLSLRYGPKVLLDGASFSLGHRDRVGLIGPNGSGKSTLMKILSGQIEPDAGSVQLVRRARAAYLPQELSELPPGSILEGVLSSVPGRTWLESRIDAAEAALAEVGRETVRQWFAAQVYAAAPVDDRVESIETVELVPRPGLVLEVDGGRVELDSSGAREQESAARAAFHAAHPEAKAEGPGPFPWRSTLRLRRYAAQVPQAVSIRFDDGTTELVRWPAEERWHRWVFDRPARVASVQIDPLREVLLDLNKLDDGRTREGTPAASARWTLEVQAWAGFLLALLGSL